MSKSIKLSQKQIDSLSQIITQRQNINAVLQDLNPKDSLILELILDANGITGTVKNVKLENGNLLFEQDEPKAKKKAEKVKNLYPEEGA